MLKLFQNQDLIFQHLPVHVVTEINVHSKETVNILKMLKNIVYVMPLMLDLSVNLIKTNFLKF